MHRFTHIPVPRTGIHPQRASPPSNLGSRGRLCPRPGRSPGRTHRVRLGCGGFTAAGRGCASRGDRRRGARRAGRWAITRDTAYLMLPTKARNANIYGGWHQLLWHQLLMPDHVHLFAALGCTEDTARDDNMHQPVHVDMHPPLAMWVRFWKRRFAQARGLPRRSWQGGMWDTRMRTPRQYEEKWAYVRENPVRYRLVARPDDWPYAGHIHDLVW